MGLQAEFLMKEENMKKYELTTESKEYYGRKLFRIKALVSFGNVKEGEMGGWIEKEQNLSHFGNAWVGGNARVYENARVWQDAQVYDDAVVFGNAWVSDKAQVCGHAMVHDDTWVCGSALVCDSARVCNNALVCGNAFVSNEAQVCGNARICGKAKICGYKDYIVIGPIGSRNAYTTFYRREDDVIMVVCGCFHDTLAAFEKRVAEVHGNNQYGKDYMATIDYVRKVMAVKRVKRLEGEMKHDKPR